MTCSAHPHDLAMCRERGEKRPTMELTAELTERLVDHPFDIKTSRR